MDGRLPVDTCCEDDGRQAEHLEQIDNETPQEFAPGWIDYVGSSVHKPYKPDRPPSLRVDFYTGELSEWLPFEHDDGARWYAAEKMAGVCRSGRD